MFDLSTSSKWGHGSPVSWSSFVSIFRLLCPSILDLDSGTGQTDRRTDNGRHCIMPSSPYGSGNIIPERTITTLASTRGHRTANWAPAASSTVPRLELQIRVIPRWEMWWKRNLADHLANVTIVAVTVRGDRTLYCFWKSDTVAVFAVLPQYLRYYRGNGIEIHGSTMGTGTAFARAVHHIWGYSDPLIYYAFSCQISMLLLPLIPYCLHFALSTALIFTSTVYC